MSPHIDLLPYIMLIRYFFELIVIDLHCDPLWIYEDGL